MSSLFDNIRVVPPGITGLTGAASLKNPKVDGQIESSTNMCLSIDGNTLHTLLLGHRVYDALKNGIGGDLGSVMNYTTAVLNLAAQAALIQVIEDKRLLDQFAIRMNQADAEIDARKNHLRSILKHILDGGARYSARVSLGDYDFAEAEERVKEKLPQQSQFVALLSGTLLDFWVARAIGHEPKFVPNDYVHIQDWNRPGTRVNGERFEPHCDAKHGLKVLQEERVMTRPLQRDDEALWQALPYREDKDPWDLLQEGPTMLIAGCRAIVADKFGATVPVLPNQVE